ncbi:MAG TPA: hypothetical protein VFU43_30965 [Streptosporangiaceae bacterium]|nr:hypothetical protein [Streptosporangiaceae bacterium]
MALSRRAKITAGAFGLTVSALFAASGSAFASADEDGTQLVIVEQAQSGQQAPAAAHAPGDCGAKGETSTAMVADSR